MTVHLYPALATSLAALVYGWAIYLVGAARGRYKIKAPAVTGHPDFERRFRIQQNTLEQLVLFLPSLWMFSLTVSPFWGGIIGLVFVAGRVVYILSYMRDPDKRGPGFIIGATATIVLLVGGLVGTLTLMLTGRPLL